MSEICQALLAYVHMDECSIVFGKMQKSGLQCNGTYYVRAYVRSHQSVQGQSGAEQWNLVPQNIGSSNVSVSSK